MAPGREANIANSGKSIDLIHNNCMLSVLIRIASKSSKPHGQGGSNKYSRCMFLSRNKKNDLYPVNPSVII